MHSPAKIDLPVTVENRRIACLAAVAFGLCLAVAVSPGLGGWRAADMTQGAAEEAKAARRRLDQWGGVWNDLHGTQRIGVQRGVKQFARGR